MSPEHAVRTRVRYPGKVDERSDGPSAITLRNYKHLTSAAGGANFKYTHSGEVLVVKYGYYTSNKPTAVTFNGDSLTELTSATFSSGCSLWYLVGADEGNYDLVTTSPSSFSVSPESWGGVASLGTPQTIASTDLYTSLGTGLTFTVSSDSVVTGVAVLHANNPFAPIANEIEMFDLTGGWGSVRFWSSYEESTGTSLTWAGSCYPGGTDGSAVAVELVAV